MNSHYHARAEQTPAASGALPDASRRLREAVGKAREILWFGAALACVAARGLKTRWRLAALCAVVASMFLPLAASLALTHRVYFDRTGLPDLDAFVRFELPTIGEIEDARGSVLIELAREHRRMVSYDEVPPILRQAILATEDKNFFSHSGVEYASIPRVAWKAASATLAAWRTEGIGAGVRLPQGGSTLTQQLVRNYFLHDRIRREDGAELVDDGLATRLAATTLGVSAANKLWRKLEEVRLTLWLEEEMRRIYGSPERAKQEIFARYASFIYLGHGRYGFAAASEYYLGRALDSYTDEDAADAALLAGISKAPRDYAPAAGAPRPLRRRNQILELMARNGYIPVALAERCQAKPVVVVARDPIATRAPAAVGSVFEELRTRAGAGLVDDLFEGRVSVRATVDARLQTIVNEALERGLLRYERRHPEATGLVQGSVVMLRNADAAVLAEAGGRQVFAERAARYSDFNRATDSLRQPGSAWKPLVYLAAFGRGLDLDSLVLDDPIEVSTGTDAPSKWISNYDDVYKGVIPVRLALAESRNAVAVWIAREIGTGSMIRIARGLGVRTPLRPYISTALGASEVRLRELAGVYRALASGLLAEPYVVARVTDSSGSVLYEAPRAIRDIREAGLGAATLLEIQEGLRGVVRLPTGTAHALDGGFPIPVMGKTGTTSDFRDALFVGSTYGRQGITVAVRVGFDDGRTLGRRETGSRVALPIFREIMLRAYEEDLVGPVPQFPREVEEGIDAYLALQAAIETQGDPSSIRFLAVRAESPQGE